MPAALVPAAIVAATALSYLASVVIGVPALVPVLNTLASFPFMIGSLRRRRIGEAVGRMIVWAAALAVCGTLMSYYWTPEAGRLFLRGESYRREMFTFVQTGVGAEGDIGQFLPMHAAHAAVFCALALATGSLLAMPMGAVLMNYMAYYVGALGAASSHPIRAMALAWVPWALIRIASFVVLGVVLAGPVLGHLFGFEYRLWSARRWILYGLAGLVADAALKWALANQWREWIRAAAGW